MDHVNKFFVASLLIHLAIATLFVKINPPEAPVEIRIVDAPAAKRVVVKKNIPEGQSEIDRAKEELNEPNPMKKKDYIYANYFERIKATVYPKWLAMVRAMPLKRMGHTYITSILVISDNVGKVLEVSLVSSSGIEGLDSIAIKSMQGEFFPNPPKGIIDPDGKIRIVWSYNILP